MATSITAQIDAICPNCSQKATYFSEQVRKGIMMVPDVLGNIRCTNCGLAKAIRFDPSMYWFKVPVEDRYLFARDVDEAVRLIEFFQSEEKTTSGPEHDFPASFYRNRAHIISKLRVLVESQVRGSNV